MNFKIKIFLFILLITTTSGNLLAQNNNLWTAFYNKDTTAVGYKDQNGIIKIEPKFTVYSHATYFKNIIAVVEENPEGNWKSYYLTKTGREVGQDSLHVFDNGLDCETEDFIRFKDYKNDKTGLFDKNGAVAVPAIYNELSRVNNGMIIALIGAEKKRSIDGEHYSWAGGQDLLIDTQNNILIENFKTDVTLNFFSLQKTKTASSDPIRDSFLAKDGSYYSFIDFEKEFKQWLKEDLLIDLTEKKLNNTSFDTITWESPDNWNKTQSKLFIADNFKVLKNGLLEILNPKTDYFIYTGSLNQFLFNGETFAKYYNGCGEANENQYPTMSIVISHNVKKDFSQNHYEFLKTDSGYKLLSVTIRNATIKAPKNKTTINRS